MAKKSKININDADSETLQQLPGVGKSLAMKIAEGRPYHHVDDLLGVKGVGRSKFDRIKSQLVVAKIETLDSELEIGNHPEVLVSEDGRKRGPILEETVPDVEEIDQEFIKSEPEKVVPQKTISRAGTLGLVFGVGIIAIVLSVITTLVIMVGINGTLDFNQLQSIQNLDTSLTSLERNLTTLSGDLDSLDQRVEPLESLGERVGSMEGQLGSVQADVNQALSSVNAMQVELDSVQAETTRLSERVIRFDNFLDGLAELMRAFSATDLRE